MEPVRIACVRYLNTVPLIEGLEKLAGVELILTVPSRIADMVAEGRADLGLVSVIDGARTPLTLLPAGMIGCDGPTMTVRLLSGVPPAQITTVYADSDSHTSVVLCRVLLERLYGVRPGVVEFDAREHVPVAGAPCPDPWPDTLLLIGDKVVTDSPPPGRYPHEIDLGEAWRRLTGLPFVYAAWACRAGEEDSRRVRTAAAILDRQRRRNAARLGWVVAARAGEHRWPPPVARRYVGSLMRYEVGPREREAVERFLAEAAALGLAPDRRVAWADLAGAPA